MDALEFAWLAALVVAIGGLFPGAIRMLAWRRGGAAPGAALAASARFAIALGLVGLFCWLVLSVVLLVR